MVKMNELSKYLKRMRIESGLTQAEVASELGYTSPQFISNWERGLVLPPISALRKLMGLIHLEREHLIRLYIAQSRLRLEKVLCASQRSK